MVPDAADMAVSVTGGGRGREEGEKSENEEEAAGDGGDEREEAAGAMEAATVEERSVEEEAMNGSANLSLLLLHRFLLSCSRPGSGLLSALFPVPEVRSSELRIQSRERWHGVHSVPGERKREAAAMTTRPARR